MTRKVSEMENKDEAVRALKAEQAQAGAEYLRAARAISKKRYDAAKKLEKLVESEINDLAMKTRFHVELTGSDEEGNWTDSGFDQVVYNDRHQSRRAVAAAGAGRVRRRALAGDAGVEGQH